MVISTSEQKGGGLEKLLNGAIDKYSQDGGIKKMSLEIDSDGKTILRRHWDD
jgi:hypothetical protein